MTGSSHKTVLIGGGRAARNILELVASKRLRVFSLEILCVVDQDLEAPGAEYADDHWWPTLTSIEEGLELPGLELVIELTGDNAVLEKIYRLKPSGVTVIDHRVARIFWDIWEYDRSLRRELREKTELQGQVEAERTHLKRILDSLPDVVMVMDVQRNIVWANRRFAEVTGQDGEAVVGQPCWRAFCKREVPPEEDDETCPAREALRTGETVVVTTTKVFGEDTRYYQVTVTPVRDTDGELVQLVETSREVTNLMNLMRATEESEQLLRSLVDAAQAFITIKDLDGNYEVVNPAAAEFFGKQPRDFMGLTPEDVLPAEVAEVFRAGDAVLMRNRTAVCFEESFALDGKRHTWRTTRFPLRDYEGRIAGICAMARDITEEKRLQAELLSSERLAAVGKAVGGLAHDVKNILNGFRGGQYVLDYGLETGDLDEIRKGKRIVERSIERVSAMVRNMLAYSKERTAELVAASPAKLIRDIGESMRTTLDEAGVALVVEDAAACGALMVDVVMIDRVLMNLVSNAIDACNEKRYDEGERPTVTLRARGEDESCLIEVVDNGIGMTDKVKENIFQQFFSTKGARGTGFGMPVSQKLVAEMGGCFEVESEPGKGTTMRLRFPAHVDASGD